MLGLLGLVGGFFSGSFTFALVVGATGGKLNDQWVYWFLSVVSAIAGLIISFKCGTAIIVFSTALVGSYFFMRSWTLFFPGNWPSEAELIKNQDASSLDMSGLFWLYVSIFLATFTLSLWYQCTRGVKNDAVDVYEKSLIMDDETLKKL